ncbi:MAG TPA: type II toxin-antitoxin system RelE/ParE family toxin [Pyrinomonadaceae bacterium]|nr:type II toxin-antitoxin system RelE/ParE family toxin [Pyrinomonadaceae bacterium]
MNWKFHEDALQELEDAAIYYDSEQTGLGRRFVTFVDDAIDGIVTTPMTWPLVNEDVRRRVLKVFPYAILYTEYESYILIVAVMHCGRNPEYWKSRLD